MSPAFVNDCSLYLLRPHLRPAPPLSLVFSIGEMLDLLMLSCLNSRCIIVFLPFPCALQTRLLFRRSRTNLLTSTFTQMWISLIVCNFVVLASAFLKLIDRYSKTTSTIYSTRGRRVGVVPFQPSRVSSSQVRTGRDATSRDERSEDVELSKLDVTVDLELGDVPTMPRTKSSSVPPLTTFDHRQVDSTA
jgi:hypothetical protein